jgi:hypothetical protein
MNSGSAAGDSVGVVWPTPPGAESRGIHLGIPQVPRDADLLRPRPDRSATPRKPPSALNATSHHAGQSVLETSGAVLMLSCIYESLNNTRSMNDDKFC